MISRSLRFVLALTVALLLASCGGDHGGSGKDTPLIFAAASLADVLGEAAEVYEGETGKRVDFSFGGSIALANQIASFGAPADGVFFVGEKPGQIIVDANLMPRSGYGNYYSNRLVVIGPKSARPLNSLEELAAQKSRVAIGDPVLAPAGVYARQALESAGIWDEISDLAIFAFDVRAAMAAVESGNARFGIVYRTDAVTSDALSIVYEIEGGHPNIEYMAIPLEGARNAEAAREFLDFIIRAQETRTLFESAGFVIVGVPGRPG